MLEKFEASPDFIAKVMARVHAYEEAKICSRRWLRESRPLRYLLAGGGTVCGVLTALPVF
jgi:hypothetical protein